MESNIKTSLTFNKRFKSMLHVDFRRFFTMPLVYIMTGVSFALPILILIMTTMAGGEGEAVEETVSTFTNVWQSIGSVSGSSMSMDLTGMCNINMLYFFVPILVCLFVGEDFKSGYTKNLFTVRSKKTDYIASKSLVCFVGAASMFLAYFIGSMIGGAIAGLSFETIGFSIGGIISCMASKMFLTMIFVAISVLLVTVGKNKLWISICGSLAAGMLLFTMIPMIAPLDSTFLNVIMSLVGGGIFIVGLGAISNVILNKTSLV